MKRRPYDFSEIRKNLTKRSIGGQTDFFDKSGREYRRIVDRLGRITYIPVVKSLRKCRKKCNYLDNG